jgi:hypothetical protein
MIQAPAPLVLLPGILQPAQLRYAPLLRELDARPAWPKELEVYAGPQPPADYGVDTEVAGLLAFADARGADRFHLCTGTRPAQRLHWPSRRGTGTGC